MRSALPIALALLVGCAGPQDDTRTDAGEVVFDFVDRFDARHAGYEVREVDFGDRAARGHLRHGWSVDEETGGETFVWATGESSSLDLFLVEPRAMALSFRATPPPFEGLPAQRVTIAVNGREVGEVGLERGWHDHRIETAGDVWRKGWNRLRFGYAFARSAAESGGAGNDTRPLSVGWDWLRLGGGGEEALPRVEAGRLVLPLATQVDYYVEVPAGSALVMPPPEASAAEDDPAPHRVEVEIAADGLPASVHPLDGAALRVGLEGLAGRHARISFRAVPAADWWTWVGERLGREPAGATEVALVRPALRAPAAPEEPAPATDAPAPPRPARRPNVLVYLVDTLRADHLGCYGYGGAISPNVDRFAADAVRFERAWAPSSWTRASVASLLTGLHPQTHGVTGRKHSLPPEADTLPERLRALGYETAGFVTNVNVAPVWGFGQGFDRYEALAEQRSREIHRLSDALNDAAFAWLEGRPKEAAPFFLYMHATDPHAPYTPREPWLGRFAAGVDPALGEIDNVKRLSLGAGAATKAERDAIVALYDAEIAFNDASFGALLERLRALGVYDSTLIVFVSDHGEEFLDHGGWQHGVTLYEEQLRIPFLVRFPDGTAAGRSASPLARLVDVLPTVLDALGEPTPPEVEGRSLLRALEAGAEASLPGIAHLDLDDHRMEAVVDGGRKLIRWLPARLHSRIEVYDLETDPGERRDLSITAGVEPGPLHASLDALAAAAALASREVEVDEEVEDRLRALGYLQ